MIRGDEILFQRVKPTRIKPRLIKALKVNKYRKALAQTGSDGPAKAHPAAETIDISFLFGVRGFTRVS